MTLLQYVRFIINLNMIYKIKSNVNKSLNSSEKFKLQAFLNSDYSVDKLNKKSIF